VLNFKSLHGILMPVNQKRTQSLFRKLGQLARKLTSDPQPEDVHQFRTTTRRVETLFDVLLPKPGRNGRKLLKQLARIRKRAGRVRDLDVQITALRTLKIGRDGEEKRSLLAALAADRVHYERKLVSLLDNQSLRELRKRLRRAAEDSYEGKFEPATKALRMFAQLARREGEVTEAVLHQYRLRCKRIRYVAEMAGKEPLAKAVVEQLKAIQDAVGEWHDWDTLTLRAEALFSDTPNAPIITALRGVRHSKLVEAMHATEAAKAELLEMHTQPTRRKKPARSAISRRSDEPALTSAASA
jgi:CHAD domain-containing protein